MDNPVNPITPIAPIVPSTLILDVFTKQIQEMAFFIFCFALFRLNIRGQLTEHYRAFYASLVIAMIMSGLPLFVRSSVVIILIGVLLNYLALTTYFKANPYGSIFKVYVGTTLINIISNGTILLAQASNFFAFYTKIPQHLGYITNMMPFFLLIPIASILETRKLGFTLKYENWRQVIKVYNIPLILFVISLVIQSVHSEKYLFVLIASSVMLIASLIFLYICSNRQVKDRVFQTSR